ncbi:MAG: aspartate aminotransferase family protein [Salinarimonadaceae bacterium]|nr:MAG: aspartate aminotransferase family protein [Salinarimonadaceae bacterium]
MLGDIFTNRASSVLHRDLRNSPPLVRRGDGPYLIGADGKRYLDASGGAAVSCLGHSDPVVAEAIRAQVDDLAYAHTSFFTNEPSEALAARLIELAPEGFGEGRVAFLGSGSEAMEAALKLARQYFVEIGQPQRSKFISRRMSYHGNSLGALAVGGHEGRRALYAPLLIETHQIAPCHAYRFQEKTETAEAYGKRVAAELDEAITRLGADTVAAFVVEPIAGATLGSVPPAPGYLRHIREICDRHGVLLIADEVMCGMGRCGAMFVSEQEGIVPDIITIAKGLGAGYVPIAAVLARERIVNGLMEGSGQLSHGHTYMSHAISCAAGLAVIEKVSSAAMLARVNTLGRRLQESLLERFSGHPHVGDIRGRGLFWSLELVLDRATKAPFAAENRLAGRIKAQAQRHGLICYPSSGTADGRNGDHVLLAPPFIIEEFHITEIIDKLEAALKSSLKSLSLAA